MVEVPIILLIFLGVMASLSLWCLYGITVMIIEIMKSPNPRRMARSENNENGDKPV